MLSIRTIILPSKAPKKWFGIDFDLNLYGHKSLQKNDVLSPFFQRELMPIESAISILNDELTRGITGKLIGIGQSGQPYSELESIHHRTHGALKLLNQSLNGVVIFTRNDGVLANLDELRAIQRHSHVFVMVMMSTYSDELSKRIEPDYCTPTQRWKLLHKPEQEKIPCGILISPIIPYINDTPETYLQIIQKAKDNKIQYVYPTFGMNLNDEKRRKFYELIDREFPGLKNVYMDNFGSKPSCQSPDAQKLKKEFVIACKKNKIKYAMGDFVKHIHPEDHEQMKLF